MQPHRSRAGGSTRRQIRPGWALASFNTLTCPTSVFYFLSLITAAAPPEPFFLKKKKKSNENGQKAGFRPEEKHRVEQGGGGRRLEQSVWVPVISMKIQSNFRKSWNISVQQVVNGLIAVAAGCAGSVWNTTSLRSSQPNSSQRTLFPHPPPSSRLNHRVQHILHRA